MCGLAGVVRVTGSGPADRTIRAAFDALEHRGPDARGQWREGPCTLLHCRLRIIDLDPRSDQPMTRLRGERVIMIYNGEVYNYRELRSQLAQADWQFTTTSDAEVLLAGYLTWGDDVFRRARGMWAVAFWHPVSQRLVLSRDPLGKKPLVYHTSPGTIAFASTVTALLPLLDTTPEVDLTAIECYLAHLVVPFEHAVFQGVAKVPPGAVVTWTPNAGVQVNRYWALPGFPGRMSTADASSEVERLLRQAIRRRLESDVPLGVFLSAGYDSGLVAAIAAQESGRPLVAVTAGTRGSGYDERDAARSIAQRYGLEHRALEVPAVSATVLPALMSKLGEPFGDPSLLPSYDVARRARAEITVALTGDGGDEAFFGYATFRGVYLAERYRQVVPGIVRRALHASSRGVTIEGWRRRAAALFEYGVGPLADSFRNRMGFTPEQRTRLLRERRAAGHSAEHIYADRLRRWGAAGFSDAEALRRTFFETFLPNDYLTKVDTATMATSLEARCPFLDADLVEFVLGLPSAVGFPSGRLKALLRPLVRRHLPAEILGRPKTGFGVPVSQWLRGSLEHAFETFVCRRGSRMASLIDPTEARDLLAAHQRGADHGTRLWALLALGVWSAVVLERTWRADEPLPVASTAGVAA